MTTHPTKQLEYQAQVGSRQSVITRSTRGLFWSSVLGEGESLLGCIGGMHEQPHHQKTIVKEPLWGSGLRSLHDWRFVM